MGCLIHWNGLRENLQETIGFPVNMGLKPMFDTLTESL